MAKSRVELMKEGKIWQVYAKDNPDTTLFECRSETACKRFITEKEGGLRRWKRGKSAYSFGQVIWEQT